MLQYIHTIWFLFITFIWIIPSKYDWYLLMGIEALLVSWVFYKNECILTYYMRKSNDPDYVLGTETDSSDIIDVIGDNAYNILRYVYPFSFAYVLWRFIGSEFYLKIISLILYFFIFIFNTKGDYRYLPIQLSIIYYIFNYKGIPIKII